MVKKIVLFVLIIVLCAVPCFAMGELSQSDLTNIIKNGTSVSIDILGSYFHGSYYGGDTFEYTYDSNVKIWKNEGETKAVSLRLTVGASSKIFKANHTYLIQQDFTQTRSVTSWEWGVGGTSFAYDGGGDNSLYDIAMGKIGFDNSNHILVNILFTAPHDMSWFNYAVTCPNYNGGVLTLTSSSVTCFGELSQDQFNDLALGKLDNIQGTIESNGQQAHEDAQDIKNSIDSNGQQAHQDAQDLKNSVDSLPDKEKAEAESASDGKADAVIGSMGDSFDVSSLKNSMKILYDSLTYHGTDCVWTFPASGNVPFLGKLWDEQQIDLAMFCQGKWWSICQPIVSFVMACGSVFLLINQLKACIYEFYGGGEDEE